METVQVTRALENRWCSAGADCKHASADSKQGTFTPGKFRKGQIALFCPLMHVTHPECTGLDEAFGPGGHGPAARVRFHCHRPDKVMALTTPCPRCRKLSAKMDPHTHAVMDLAQRLDLI